MDIFSTLLSPCGFLQCEVFSGHPFSSTGLQLAVLAEAAREVEHAGLRPARAEGVRTSSSACMLTGAHGCPESHPPSRCSRGAGSAEGVLCECKFPSYVTFSSSLKVALLAGGQGTSSDLVHCESLHHPGPGNRTV